ncbi:30S ribosomal protein S2 [Roseovarius gaetbuli]|uniref:30S ribosomal protein S2 n=1 Tax=Roseovarius gaetbuli TaxID=1356575 RepID=A0A1X6YAQ5_9RHOB|nr:NADH:ubiquinone oxidoreductase [Roseovarius gaetbuli]SLN15375.1 30S ribosomal protein S2 [Roseovarius gaetbuli]
MSDTSKLSTCQLVCWGLAVLVGLLVLWATYGEVGFFAALLLGLACAAFFGLVISRLICTGYAPEDRGIEGKDIKAKMAEVTGVTGYVAPDEEESTALVDHPATTAVAHVAEAPVPAPVEAKSDVLVVKSGTTLSGEEELSARKGEWRYEGEADDKPAAAPKAKAKPAASDAPAGAGTRPEALSAPKGGKADDLKQIKGVGPKLEILCNELGFFHFDQIAGWGADEVTWVDQNLKGFKGRVSRDNWVEQAKVLAAGGETEFSKRVAKGGVYEG